MNFLAVFIGNNWTFCCTSISTKDNTIFINDANNGCAGFDCLRLNETALCQRFIAATKQKKKSTKFSIVYWGYVLFRIRTHSEMTLHYFYKLKEISVFDYTYRRQLSKLNPVFWYSANNVPLSNESILFMTIFAAFYFLKILQIRNSIENLITTERWDLTTNNVTSFESVKSSKAKL